jgi:hypothetical protein
MLLLNLRIVQSEQIEIDVDKSCIIVTIAITNIVSKRIQSPTTRKQVIESTTLRR